MHPRASPHRLAYCSGERGSQSGICLPRSPLQAGEPEDRQGRGSLLLLLLCLSRAGSITGDERWGCGKPA